MTDRTQPLEGEHLPRERAPLPARRIPLKTLRDVRREMGRVYCESRRGTLDVADGSRLIYMLSQVGKVIADHELEARIAALESRQ